MPVGTVLEFGLNPCTSFFGSERCRFSSGSSIAAAPAATTRAAISTLIEPAPVPAALLPRRRPPDPQMSSRTPYLETWQYAASMFRSHTRSLPSHQLFYSPGWGWSADTERTLPIFGAVRCGWVRRRKTAPPNRAADARHPHRSSANAPTWVGFPSPPAGLPQARGRPGRCWGGPPVPAGGPSSQNMDSIPHLNCEVRLGCLGGGWGAYVTAG